uniref:Uncharacterized protein n=1 Tax=Glossina morsitans morsitans TaxID=37546 RepID=A0A1B0FCD8_GLOMM
MVERILEENIATESGNGGSSYDNSNSIDNINNNIDTTAVAESNDGGNSIIAANANEPDKNNCNQLAGTDIGNKKFDLMCGVQLLCLFLIPVFQGNFICGAALSGDIEMLLKY